MGAISERLINTGYFILVKDIPDGVKIEYNKVLSSIKTAVISSSTKGVTLTQTSEAGDVEETFVPSLSDDIIDPHKAAKSFLTAILNEMNITQSIVFVEKEESGKKDYIKYFEE
jgi:hypothetical protein